MKNMPSAGKNVDLRTSRNGSKMAHRVFLNVSTKNDVIISNLLRRNKQLRQQQHRLQQQPQQQHPRQQRRPRHWGPQLQQQVMKGFLYWAKNIPSHFDSHDFSTIVFTI